MSSRQLPRQRGEFERTRNHWWWRDGWHPGARYLTWHLTFEEATSLHDAAQRAGGALREVTGVDVVPVPWLHLTMTGLGFVQDLAPSTVERIAEAGLDAATGLDVEPLVFDSLFLSEEGIALSTTAPWLQELKAREGDLVQSVGGPAPSESQFHPHVSLAYFSREISESAVHDALDVAAIGAVVVPAPRLSLIELGRDDRVYTWRVVAQRTLGS